MLTSSVILGKMCLKIMLKVTKNQGFALSLEDTFFQKPQGGGGQIDPPLPPSRFWVKVLLLIRDSYMS